MRLKCRRKESIMMNINMNNTIKNNTFNMDNAMAKMIRNLAKAKKKPVHDFVKELAKDNGFKFEHKAILAIRDDLAAEFIDLDDAYDAACIEWFNVKMQSSQETIEQEKPAETEVVEVKEVAKATKNTNVEDVKGDTMTTTITETAPVVNEETVEAEVQKIDTVEVSTTEQETIEKEIPTAESNETVETTEEANVEEAVATEQETSVNEETNEDKDGVRVVTVKAANLYEFLVRNLRFEVVGNNGKVAKWTWVQKMFDKAFAAAEKADTTANVTIQVADMSDDVADEDWDSDVMCNQRTICVVDGLTHNITIRPKDLTIRDKEVKVKKYYNAFDAFSKQAKRELMAEGMQKICEKAGVKEDDIIQINFMWFDTIVKDPMAAKNRIRAAIRNGIVIKDGTPFFTDDNENNSVRYALYSKERIEAVMDNDAKIYMAAMYTSSGRMNGSLLFVKQDKVDAFQIAAHGTDSKTLQRISVRQFTEGCYSSVFACTSKNFKYMGLALGAKKDFYDMDMVHNPHVMVVNKKAYSISDGDIYASTEIGLEAASYQSRLYDTCAKANMDVNNAMFEDTMQRLRAVGLGEDSKSPDVRHYGDLSLPVSAVMDTDTWKHDIFRASINGCLHWCVKRFDRTPNRATLSVSALSKLLRVYDMSRDIFTNVIYKAAYEEAVNHMVESIHPNPNSGYALHMLAGLDTFATVFGLKNAYEDCLPQNDGDEVMPLTTIDAWVLPIHMSHAFDEREARKLKDFRIDKHNDYEYVIFAAPETARIIGRLLLCTRYPESGENNRSLVHVVVDDMCTEGQIYCAHTVKGERFKLVHTGMDFDGDKLIAITLRDDNKTYTIIGKLLKDKSYKADVIKNDFADIAVILSDKHQYEVACRYKHKDCTGREFFEDTYALSFGQTGMIISYNNVVKMAAIKYCTPNKDAIDYAFEWNLDKDEYGFIMRASDIRRWMQYVGDNGTNVRLTADNIKRWREDVGIIGNWCAECSTATSTNGYGIPDDIFKFFKAFFFSIYNKVHDKETAAFEDWKTSHKDANPDVIAAMEKQMVRSFKQLQTDLSLGEDLIVRDTIIRAIDDAHEYVLNTFGIADDVKYDADETRTLGRNGFWDITNTTREHKDMPIWEYYNASLFNARKLIKVKDNDGNPIDNIGISFRKDDLTTKQLITLEQKRYATRVFPWQALVNNGYDKDDVVKMYPVSTYMQDKAVMTLEFFDDDKIGLMVYKALCGDADAIAQGYGFESICVQTSEVDENGYIFEKDKGKVLDRTFYVDKVGHPYNKQKTFHFINTLSGPTDGKWNVAYVIRVQDYTNNRGIIVHKMMLLLDKSYNV